MARGLTWTFIDTWGSQVFGFVIFVLLARLLTPVDFGLVALAGVFVIFCQLLVDQGLGDAIIQKPTVTRRQLATAFWAALLTGSLLTVAGILLAAPIATLLGDVRLEPILQVLSLTFLLASLSSIQMAVLRREMAFRSLALRRLLGVAGGGAIGVALAFLGFGAWALVGQQLATAAISVLALWTVSPWRPSLEFSRADFRQLFSYGVNVVAGDILNFLSRNTDNLLIGVFLGPTALGFYAVAYRVLDTSQVLLIAASRKIVFPAFARLQHDADRVRRAYLRVSRASSVITLPGYIGLALVAHEAIVVFFGPKWGDSAPVAVVLFLIGPVLTLQSFSGSVWNALGHPHVTLRFRLLSTIADVAGFVVAVALFGTIISVAVAFVLRGYLLLPLNLYWMQKYGGVPIRDHLWDLRRIAAATVVMGVSVLVTKMLLAASVHAGLLLLAEVVVGIVSYGGTLFVLDRDAFRDVLTIGLKAVPGGERLARRLRLPIERKNPRRRGNRPVAFAASDEPEES